MRIYNNYIISLVLAFGAINSIMAAAGQQKLDVYFTVNIIAYLVISLLYVYFNPRARRVLNTLGVVLFGGFLVIVAFKVMEVLGR
ncbi:MAG: hypothetical protein DDT26_01386 [Dehalococcoidia bacterium]|nr:hypothetical protein [Chloroflexota bacterium]